MNYDELSDNLKALLCNIIFHELLKFLSKTVFGWDLVILNYGDFYFQFKII